MKSRFSGWTSTKKLNSNNNNNQDHKKEDLPEQGSRISEVLQDLCYSGRQARNQSWMWWKRCDHCPWLSPALAAQSYLVRASCCHLPSISTQKLTSLNQVIERKKPKKETHCVFHDILQKLVRKLFIFLIQTQKGIKHNPDRPNPKSPCKGTPRRARIHTQRAMTQT